MNDRECLWAGVAISLFAHFALCIAPGMRQETPPAFRTVVQMDMESSAVDASSEQGTGVVAASAADVRDAKAADRKRRAFLQYLDDIDEAVHARRLEDGNTELIGVVAYTFTVRADGSFSEPDLYASSGDPRLDASARRAILAASGKVRRPALLGSEPIHVVLHVKYQHGLK